MCSLVLPMLKAHNWWTRHTLQLVDTPKIAQGQKSLWKGFSDSTHNSNASSRLVNLSNFLHSETISGQCMSRWCEKSSSRSNVDGWALVNWSSRDPTGCQLLSSKQNSPDLSRFDNRSWSFSFSLGQYPLLAQNLSDASFVGLIWKYIF